MHSNFNDGLRKKGISSMDTSGVQVINGRRDKTQSDIQSRSIDPYYPHAKSISRDHVNRIKKGYPVFTMKKKTSSRCYSTDSYSSQNENAALPVLCALNGMGNSTTNNEDVQYTIQFRGIAEIDEDNSLLFPIIYRGSMDIQLIGNKPVEVNQKLLLYCPSMDELAGLGSIVGREELDSGIIRPWIMPYDETIHMHHTRQIWACLNTIATTPSTTTGSNKKNYHPSYVKHTKTIMKSLISVSVMALKTVLPELKKMLMPGKTLDDSVLLANVAGLLGHSDFQGPTNNKAASFIDTIFHPHSTIHGTQTHKLFTGNLDINKTRLNKMQVEAMPELLQSLGDYNDEIRRNNIGTTNTAGRPGDFINVILES